MKRLIRWGPSILRHYGVGWVGYRAVLSIAERTGSLRRSMPMGSWSAQPPSFCSPGASLLPAPPAADLEAFRATHPAAIEALREEAEAILQGRFRLFEGPPEPRGFPPAWNQELDGMLHPVEGVHWSLARPKEDIKLVWELSRFRWATVLGRAFAFTGDARYAEGFWHLLEDWRLRNPPNQGPNWMCGQEASLRIFALCLAEVQLGSAACSTPSRLAALRETVHALARRIEPHLSYARSQRNNHALNEALGLLTAACLLPEAPEARRWRRKGLEAFEEDLLDQMDPEGSYIQHSVTYHRVAMHACLWFLALADRHGIPVSPGVKARIHAGARWLRAMTDPSSGQAPNLGSNDGANNLPLSTCDYLDMRPTIQATNGLLGLPLPYPAGPWDELLLWISGRAATGQPAGPSQPLELHAAARGHFLRHSEGGRVYLRCPSYRERPSQSDTLHLDLTWKGLNILCDPGTFRYNGPAPWGNGLAWAWVHNSVTLKGSEPMARLGPFLWLEWDQARMLSRPEDPVLSGERLPTRHSPLHHRRMVIPAGPEHWVVVDDALAPGDACYRLHWLMPDLPIRLSGTSLELQTDQGPFGLSVLGPGTPELHRAGTAPGLPPARSTQAGWRSLRYNELQPALSMAVENRCHGPVRWVSVFGTGPLSAESARDTVLVHTPAGPLSIPLPPSAFP